MNEPRDPAFRTEPPGSDEALSAYLLGELDTGAAAAFEARLAGEPGLAAQLDALADALAQLGGVDDVAEPDGFAERLQARLDAEALAPDLSARRRTRWNAVMTAAAGVAVLAVAGLQVLGGGAEDRGESAQVAMEADEESAAGAAGLADESRLEMETSQDYGSAGADGFGTAAAPMPPEEERQLESTSGQAYRAPADDGTATGGSGNASGGGAAGAEGAEGGTAPAPMAASAGPVILDEGAELDSDEQLRARYMGLPEAERLRGMPRDEASETAVRHAEQIRAAEPFPSSGVRPDACLDEVRGGPDARVTARVERVRWQGGEALVYLLGLPAPGSGQVDRFELWVLSPQGCDTRRFLTWE